MDTPKAISCKNGRKNIEALPANVIKYSPKNVHPCTKVISIVCIKCKIFFSAGLAIMRS